MVVGLLGALYVFSYVVEGSPKLESLILVLIFLQSAIVAALGCVLSVLIKPKEH